MRIIEYNKENTIGELVPGILSYLLLGGSIHMF